MRVHLDGHRMTIIAGNDISVTRSTVDRVVLDVGEWCAVIVEINDPSEITGCNRSWIRADGAACAHRALHGRSEVVETDDTPRTEPRNSNTALRVRGNIQVPTLSTLDIREISLE